MITAKFPDGQILLVLDPDITDLLLQGEVVPVKEFNIALGYVKDPAFVEREMEKANHSFSPQQLGQLLDAANKREEVRRSRGKPGKGNSVIVQGV